MGRAWLLTAALHGVAVILVFTVPWQAPRHARYVVLEPLDARDTLQIAPFAGSRPNRARGPRVQTTARAPEADRPTPTPAAAPADSGEVALLPAYDPEGPLAIAPRVGDGRLWVSPRPGLPAAVADALYGDKEARDSAAIGRLRTMVDSLNVVLDELQRNERRPSWTVGGEEGTPKFGIDSQFIHVGPIKIPTMALAFLGSVLPQGNYDEGLRARHLQEMREDLLRAADRAQTFQDFKRYVRELRERKQAERDAERRRRGQDTVRVVP